MTAPAPGKATASARSEITDRAEEYRTGGVIDRNRLARAVAEASGDPTRTIYTAKLTRNGYWNQVWQGRGNTQQHDVFALVDQSGNVDGVRDAVLGRLKPATKSGFDAVVVARRTHDEWEVHAVVEYPHSKVGPELAHQYPNLQRITVPDPANAARAMLTTTSKVSHRLTSQDVLVHLDEAKNVILEGPPGTGKTRLAFEVVATIAQENPDPYRLESIVSGDSIDSHEDALRSAPVVWEFVQFHPASTYEDFVRGQRTDPDVLGFELRTIDGVLPRICRVAALRAEKPTVLVIDEINRGNLSSILGETIFAVDQSHREQEVVLQYDAPPDGSSTLMVPSNLFVLGTMNTADRSLAVIDFAIRRRFRFLRLDPSPEGLAEHYAGFDRRQIIANAMLEALSSCVPDPDLRLGHSYLMVPAHESIDDASWAMALVNKLIFEVRPLLDEYLEEGVALNPCRAVLPSGAIDVRFDDVSTLLDGILTSTVAADDAR